MPLHWSISTTERLVILRTKDVVKFSDLEIFLNDIQLKAATSYYNLLDARDGFSALSSAELSLYEAKIVECALYHRLGPLAIVVNEKTKDAHGSLVALLLSSTRRASRLFFDVHEAREWLRTQSTG